MNIEENVNGQQTTQPILLKKRGRKPKNRDNLDIDKINENVDLKKKELNILPSPKKSNFIYKIENTILHFPIKTDINKPTSIFTFNTEEDTRNDFTRGKVFPLNKDEPTPYDPNVFINMHADFENATHSFAYVQNDIPKNKNLKLGTINKTIRIVPVLNEFIQCNNEQTMPEQTDICCFWDTEKFDNQPLGMPEKKVGDTFFVKGCFCSFNCMASYSFSLNDDKVWERFALINLMYKKMYNLNQNFKVELAPPREALKKFGGIYGIDRFRELCNEKSIKTLSFPIINIQSYLEEINLKTANDNASSNGPTHLDVKNYLDKVNNDYKLSRNKNLGSSQKNTLEFCMGLKKV